MNEERTYQEMLKQKSERPQDEDGSQSDEASQDRKDVSETQCKEFLILRAPGSLMQSALDSSFKRSASEAVAADEEAGKEIVETSVSPLTIC